MTKCRACIRHVASGEERVHEEAWDTEWGDAGTFMFHWLENNYSCDCNRQLMFDRIPPGVRGPNDCEGVKCGSERYRVMWLEFDGERLEGDADRD